MKKRILAVEDDSDILWMVEYILTEQGFEVYTSLDGKNILEEVEKTHPDLILMDVRLPGADGRELCRIIRTADKRIPIILMSAHLDYAEAFREVCANDFMPKPFDIDDLIRRIQKQLAA